MISICVHVVNRIQIMFVLVRAIEKTLIYKLDDMLYALKGLNLSQGHTTIHPYQCSTL